MVHFRIKQYKLFKVDSIMSLLSNIVFLIGTILFWFFVTDAGFVVNGWTYNEILVFIAFSELFYGFEQNVFSVASRYWYIIYGGVLDCQLVRPFDSRKRFILLNMDYLGLVLTFVKVAIIIYISGFKFRVINFLISVLIIFLSNYVLMLISFSISYSAFWLGKMDSLSKLCDCLTKFNKYPLVILPVAIRVIFMTVLPFYFFSTFSAQYILNKLSLKNTMIFLLGLLLNIILWSILHKIIWMKGRGRYESLNG